MEFNEMFEIKEKKDIVKSPESNDIAKYVLWRLLILPVGIGLIFLVLYLMDEYSGMLAAFYLSGFFVLVWLGILILECLIRILGGDKKKGLANFYIVLAIFVLVGILFTI